MINVSSEFKEFMESSSDFRPHADITFPDGRTLNLSIPDLSVTGNTIADAAGSTGIPLGVAICRTIQLEILNPDEKFKDYDFYGAEIHLYTTAQLSETTERIENGRFTVTSPEEYGTTIVVTAFDAMYKADKPYTTSLPFPASAGAILRDSCTTCGIPIGTAVFPNDGFVVENMPPSEYTHRQIIGFIAMIASGNARISRNGYLEIIPYELDYSKGYHVLNKWKDIKISPNENMITEVRTTGKDEEGNEIYFAAAIAPVQTDSGDDVYTDDGVRALAVVSGMDTGYVVSVTNPLISGHEQEAINYIAHVMAAVPFRKFDGQHICYPLAEFMDLAEIYDWRGNAYRTFLTDVNFEFFGFTEMKNSSENEYQSRSMYASPTVEVLNESRELVEKEKTDRELAQKQLENQLSNNTGMYTTEVPQESGGVIRYVHDKPTLAESQSVIKYAADAIGLSTDGGVTYPYGFFINGDTITRYLYAVGINADYITAGALTIRDNDGNIIFTADKDTKTAKAGGWEIGDGYMRSKNANERYTGVGVSGKAYAFYAGGVETNGEDAPFRVSHDGTVRASKASIEGEINATSGVFNGVIYATGGKFTGEIRGETIDIKSSKNETYGLWEAALTADSDNGLMLSYDQVNYGGYISMGTGVTEIYDGNNVVIHSPQGIEISGFDVSITADNGLTCSGSLAVAGGITCSSGRLYMSDWVQFTNTAGVYWGSYGGGWYMNDANWIRAWNDKGIHTAGTVSAAVVNVNTGGNNAYVNLGNKGAMVYAENGSGDIVFRYRTSASANFSYASVVGIMNNLSNKAAMVHSHSNYLPTSGGTVSGALSVSNNISILGTTTATGAFKNIYAYNNTTTSASNLHVNSSGTHHRSTASSRRYKHGIRPLSGELEASRLLSVPVVQYVYNADYLSDDDPRYGRYIPGFIAEDVAKYYPVAAELDDGQVEDWNIRMIVPPMLALIQELYKKIERLERIQ